MSPGPAAVAEAGPTAEGTMRRVFLTATADVAPSTTASCSGLLCATAALSGGFAAACSGALGWLAAARFGALAGVVAGCFGASVTS